MAEQVAQKVHEAFKRADTCGAGVTSRATIRQVLASAAGASPPDADEDADTVMAVLDPDGTGF
eukprot:7913236-Heterocapsa_arctica.AAC.1